jgi:hypothetical protein
MHRSKYQTVGEKRLAKLSEFLNNTTTARDITIHTTTSLWKRAGN